MNADQMRIKIAEFYGYAWYRAPQDKHFPEKKYRFLAFPAVQEYEQVDIWKQRADGTEQIITSIPWMKAQNCEIPDYPSDLNAIAEAVRKIQVTQGALWAMHLRAIVARDCKSIPEANLDDVVNDAWFYNATAAQRAEALCMVIDAQEYAD